MIKIYSMNTCPDCIYVEEQIQGDDRYEIINIGSHVKYLKEFLRIRDNNSSLKFEIMAKQLYVASQRVL